MNNAKEQIPIATRRYQRKHFLFIAIALGVGLFSVLVLPVGTAEYCCDRYSGYGFPLLVHVRVTNIPIDSCKEIPGQSSFIPTANAQVNMDNVVGDLFCSPTEDMYKQLMAEPKYGQSANKILSGFFRNLVINISLYLVVLYVIDLLVSTFKRKFFYILNLPMFLLLFLFAASVYY
ncbi:MAG: hypothetical protein V1916_03025 [Patescibacteria group bacterium]